ncbi:hypothetical protein FRC11_009636, partial [Ceratobasidium sp. 423]
MEAPLPGATATTPFNPNQARSSITSLLLISIVLFLLSGDDPAVQVQQATFFNLSDPAPSNYTWNWNQTAGPLVSGLNHTKVNASLGDFHWAGIDKIAGNVRELKINRTTPYAFLAGHIDFVNSKDDVLVNYQLEGIHFFEDGSIYGLMEPRGLEPDLRQLIPLVPTPLQNATAYAIKDEIDRQIHVLQDRIKNPGGGQAEDKNSITTCSFQLYGQIKAADFPAYLMQELESETEDPTGVRTVSRPPLKLNGLILSPDCAVALTFKDAVGMQATIFWQKATSYAFVASVCYFIILKLIVRQMETSRTPSAIAKISRWTFALQAIADAYSFVGHVTVGIVSESRSSLSIIAPGFLAATLFLVFEVRFSMLIHQIQGPEDAVMRAPIIPSPTAPTATDEAETPLLTNQQTATPTPPQPNPPSAWMVQVRRTFDAARLFVDSMTDPDSKFLQITVSPRLVLYAIGALYSFWVPQIMRNVKRGTRKALQKRYVIGTTLCRLFFPLCKSFDLPPMNPKLNGYSKISLSARVMSFLPNVSLVEIELYDWHPPIARPDAEAPNPSLGDCAICMDDILLDSPDASGGKEGASLLAGVGMGTKCVYAVAPCHHMFHTKCLEQWLAIK